MVAQNSLNLQGVSPGGCVYQNVGGPAFSPDVSERISSRVRPDIRERVGKSVQKNIPCLTVFGEPVALVLEWFENFRLRNGWKAGHDAAPQSASIEDVNLRRMLKGVLEDGGLA
ncbi:MAG: hypothetical protein AAF357_13560 [Verrucomicrobiota bacterium]